MLVSSMPDVYADSGHASGLGPFTGSSTLLGNPSPTTVLVQSVWDFADGSLTVVIETTFVDPSGAGTFTIIGGTGVFDGASGGGDYEGEAVGPGEVKSKLRGEIQF